MSRRKSCSLHSEELEATSFTYARPQMAMSDLTRAAGRKSKLGRTSQPTHKAVGSQCCYPTMPWGPVPVSAEDHDRVQSMKQHEFTLEFLRSAWLPFHQPPTKLASMNVEETAVWVLMLAGFKGWDQARTYAQAFRTNDIAGYMLPHLSVKALRSELGIFKFGHRLEIIAAIKNSELTMLNPIIVSLKPDPFFMFGTPETPNYSQDLPEWMKIASNCDEYSTKCPESPLYGADWIYDPDKKIDIWVTKSNLSNKMKGGISTKPSESERAKKGSESKYSWIPPIELPPATLDFDEMERMETKARLNEKRVSLDEERSSSIFSSDRSVTTGGLDSWDAPAAVTDL